MDYINPTNDLAFKKVFASEENKDILQGFINDFFGIIAEDIEILSPYSIDIFKKWIAGGGDINELRQTLRDITASFKTADFVSELQIQKSAYFDERSLYYPLKRFCENYNSFGKMQMSPDGRPNLYSSLRPVYALNVLGYNHFNDDESLRIFELYDPKRNKSPNKELLRIGYFELTKAKIETENQQYWRDYFNKSDISPNAPDYIKKARGVIDFANLNEEERNMSEMMEKAMASLQSEKDYCYFEGINVGKVEGIAIGKAEGMVEGIATGISNTIALMKRLIGEGLSPEEAIRQLTINS